MTSIAAWKAIRVVIEGLPRALDCQLALFDPYEPERENRVLMP